MKKSILFLLLLTLQTYANINVVVSILPQQSFLKSIAGDKVNITLMVLPGNSPHTYEPKPSQMMAISKADLYLAMSVEFEHVWLPKFKNTNDKMKIVDISQGIEKISSHTSHAHHAHEEHEEHGTKDPHVWTAPDNVKIIAENIYEALVKVDAKHKAFYKKNLDTFLASIAKTDVQIKKTLSTLKGHRTFMVFHPSWGYFAKAYSLEQIAVEVEGKSPKPKELVHLIKEAKEKKVTAIITQPEFSDASAKIIAKELQIPVVKISPMASDWSQNLMRLARSIAGQDK